MRRTLLFLPGNNPGNLQSGAVFGADGIILDLEDSGVARRKGRGAPFGCERLNER